MKLEFELIKVDSEVAEIIPDFCDLLLTDIKDAMYDNINLSKAEDREEELINANWIKWIDKPDHINMTKLCQFISNNLVIKKRKDNCYIIEIDKNVNMTNTRTSIDKVVRFLNSGNESKSPMYFMTRTFREYRTKIKSYWKSYLSIRLRRLDVKCVVRIK